MAATKINRNQIDSVVTSTGSNDANKVVVTDSNGKIADATLPNSVIAYVIALGGM
jgi:hypothetical protein